MTVAARPAVADHSAARFSAKLVSASASSTTPRSALSAVATSSRISAPTPPPGPSTIALKRRSSSIAASPAAPSTARTITARVAAAWTASASGGEPMVTHPPPAPRAGRRRPAGGQPRGAGAGGATRPDHGMAPAVFVGVDPRNREMRLPQLRGVGEGAWPDVRKHLGLDADVGDPHLAAGKPAGQQQMSGLAAKEGDGLGRLNGAAEPRPRGAVDSARQVDREDRRAASVHRLDHVAGRALDRAGEPGTEDRVDDDAGVPQAGRRSRLDRARKTPRRFRRFAVQALPGPETKHSHAEAALGQEPRR